MNKITVVIPYFQREPGILARAMRSALAQRGVEHLEIIVVDDASPVSARSELAAIEVEQQHKVRIIEQANAGPAAARNKGLDQVSSDTQFVAFLDSDDEWTEEHIANALLALGQENDFYFADLYQLDQSVTAFNRAKRINPSEHPCIRGTDHLHQYAGDMFDQVIRGNVIGTPTVVYRYAKFPELRFREEFVYAGEDYFFWLELSKRTDKIVFCSLPEVVCGKGVNVFAGSGWGTEKSLIRAHYEIKYKKALLKLFDLTPTQARTVRGSVKTLRRSFTADLLNRLTHRTPLDWAALRQQSVTDPQTFIYFVPLSLLIALERVSGAVRRRSA